MTNRTFVEIVIAQWQALQSRLPSVVSEVRYLPDNSKVSISIETQEHFALVEIWEHAACLDTTFFSKDAKLGTLLAAGPCIGETEVGVRLEALQNALSGFCE